MKPWVILTFLMLQLLTGCKKQPPEPVRVAEKMQISCRHDYGVWRWEYEDEEKIHALLQYLRRCRSAGTPEVDPQTLDMNRYQIEVILSDGSREVFYQQGDSYFSRECEPWQCLEPAHGQQLEQLLRRMPTDRRPVRRVEMRQ